MYQAKKIIKPPYLKAGDKVALVSPAYWMPEEAILQAAEGILIGGDQSSYAAITGTKYHHSQKHDIILFVIFVCRRCL